MFLWLYVPLLLSASTTTAKSKVSKLEESHHNSRVNVPKLPFSARVNILTLLGFFFCLFVFVFFYKYISLSAHMERTVRSEINQA